MTYLKRQSKYWICDNCADKQGLIAPTWAVTVARGFCCHCDREDKVILTPVIDFADPKTGREAEWE